MQNNLEISVLEAGYENLKASLMSNLEGKGRYIRDARQKELTEGIVKRINSEEKHIKICIGLTESAENLIQALQEQNQLLRERLIVEKMKVDHFYNEFLYYMDQWNNLLMDKNDIDRDYNILKYGTREAK